MHVQESVRRAVNVVKYSTRALYRFYDTNIMVYILLYLYTAGALFFAVIDETSQNIVSNCQWTKLLAGLKSFVTWMYCLVVLPTSYAYVYVSVFCSWANKMMMMMMLYSIIVRHNMRSMCTGNRARASLLWAKLVWGGSLRMYELIIRFCSWNTYCSK